MTEAVHAHGLAYELGGFATGPEPINVGITSLDPDDGGLASCAFTWWTPPGPPALDHATCDQLIDLHPAGFERTDVELEEWRAPTWALAGDVLGAQLAEQVIAAAVTANRYWWRLHITEYFVEVKRYQPGHEHREHVDLHPTSMTRKVQASIALSDPGDYTGGVLQLRYGGYWFDAPRDRGAVTVLPAWIPHRVTPVESGQRWVLIVTGSGPVIQ